MKRIFSNRDQVKEPSSTKVEEGGPKIYRFRGMDESPQKDWVDNNGIIPAIKTWSQFRAFLKDANISLAAKLEFIDNLDASPKSSYCSTNEGVPIPDEFWQDDTLDRKIRAYCKIKSQYYLSLKLEISDSNRDEILFKQLIENSDDELFLGICELQEEGLYHLLENEKVTLSQKELIVKNAINFKKNFTNQKYSGEQYLLLKALELNIFSTELMNEIYNATKQNMIRTGSFAHSVFPVFINRFYSDTEVSREQAIGTINKGFHDQCIGDYDAAKYAFYIGNDCIPAYVQDYLINRLIELNGKYLPELHDGIFKRITATNYLSLLKHPWISIDSKLKFINITTNPVILCFAMLSEEIEPELAQVIRAKLESTKIKETSEFLEMMRACTNNQEAFIRKMDLQPR